MIDIGKLAHVPSVEQAESFCSSNIALCKYWGKRERTLNIPNNSSLSISLGKLGTRSNVRKNVSDVLTIDGRRIPNDNLESVRVFKWLDFIVGRERPPLHINTFSNIPINAGLASSASAFASITRTMDKFFGWQLSARTLALIARIGSASAARSIFQGFVKTTVEKPIMRSVRIDECYTERLPYEWSELRIGVYHVSASQKKISSRNGMNLTTETSPIYEGWVDYANQSCEDMIHFIKQKNFSQLGEEVERNALMMHGTMLGCKPPLTYLLPESLSVIQKVQALRNEGITSYVTIDAGANVKILFLESQQRPLLEHFPKLEIIAPFDHSF